MLPAVESFFTLLGQCLKFIRIINHTVGLGLAKVFPHLFRSPAVAKFAVWPGTPFLFRKGDNTTVLCTTITCRGKLGASKNTEPIVAASAPEPAIVAASARKGEPALLMRLFNPCVRQANCLGRL